MTEDPIKENTNLKQRRTHVRLSEADYLRIAKDHLETGKSIPWLLKTAYFKRGISAPTLDVETRKSVRCELGHIGNNLNQLARVAHVKGLSDIKAELMDAVNYIRILKSFLVRDYGDR